MALMEPGAATAAYKAKILSYQAGADYLALQEAAPEKLASVPRWSARVSCGHFRMAVTLPKVLSLVH